MSIKDKNFRKPETVDFVVAITDEMNPKNIYQIGSSWSPTEMARMRAMVNGDTQYLIKQHEQRHKNFQIKSPFKNINK